MNTIKKISVVGILAVFMFAVSSCNNQTCPTYSKADNQTTETRV